MKAEPLTMESMRERGLVVVRYHAPPPRSDVRHGWIVEERENSLLIQLVGDDRPQEIAAGELRFVTRIEAPAEKAGNPCGQSEGTLAMPSQ